MNEAPPLSLRAREMPASPIRRLAPFAAEARRAGKKVYALNIGQPDIPTPDEILARLRTFDEANIAYGPSQGLPGFIEAVRRYHGRIGIELESEDIFITTGGSEALLFVFGAIADHGDEVVVVEPFYTNYSGFAGLVGVRTVPVTTRAEDGYHLPPREAFEERITDRTRAIVLCSPNNPTGTVYDSEELERVAALCRDRGLYLIADEVYREFTYDGLQHRSTLTLEGMEQRVIVTDSLSKRVSMCGARIGWIVSRNRELMQSVLKFGQARLCPPTLGQYLGEALLEVPESYMSGVVAEYQRRRDVVYEALSATPGVTVRRPEGAFYLCARLPVDDCQKFAEFLLRDHDLDGETVMIAPADGFYATPGLGRDEARIAYVLNEGDLKRAMKSLVAGLEAYQTASRRSSSS
jgi:aspartate aminotransferase